MVAWVRILTRGYRECCSNGKYLSIESNKAAFLNSIKTLFYNSSSTKLLNLVITVQF